MLPTGDSLQGKDKRVKVKGMEKDISCKWKQENRGSNTYMRSSTCIEAIKQASTYLNREKLYHSFFSPTTAV